MADRRRHRPERAAAPVGPSVSESWLEVRGQVVRLLPDDSVEGSHQRFIIDIGGGQTLLVAHNLELAGRVPLGLGDRLSIRGFYEWNDLGGALHWTHRDPMGIEEGGYVIHRRKRYE